MQPEIFPQRAGFAPGLPQLQRGIQRDEDALRAQRLLEKVVRAELGRLYGVRELGVPAHHHHGHVGREVAQARQCADAVEFSRHHEVEQNHVGL